MIKTQLKHGTVNIKSAAPYITFNFFMQKVQGKSLFQAGETWTADDNMNDARMATDAAGLRGGTLMSWFCDSGGGAVAGIAFVGGLCKWRGYNTNLNEKQRTVAADGFVSF